jgi:hypothetical protein
MQRRACFVGPLGFAAYLEPGIEILSFRRKARLEFPRPSGRGVVEHFMVGQGRTLKAFASKLRKDSPATVTTATRTGRLSRDCEVSAKKL